MVQGKTIEAWIVHSGCLRGFDMDEPQRYFKTSLVMSRVDRVVTTVSGSTYILGMCNPSQSDEQWIAKLDMWSARNVNLGKRRDNE